MSETWFGEQPDDYDECASVFRAGIDARVWMCNIPNTDVATGIEASTSLRRIKAYVEEKCGEGNWARTGPESWEFRWLN